MGRRKKKKPSLKESVPTLAQLLSRFWPLIRKERAILGGAFVAMMLEVAFRLLEPWPLKFVFDHLLAPPDPQAAAPVLGTTAMLLLVALAVVAIAGLRALAYYARSVGFALAGSRVLSECRAELFSHLQRLSLSFHKKRRSGDLITRVTGDITQLKDVVITAMLPMIGHLAALLGMLAVMFWLDWRLALVAAAIVPLFLLSTRRIGGRIRNLARTQRQRRGEMGATAAEAFGSIQVVQALSLEGMHAKSFSARDRSDLREGVKARRLSARLVSTTDVLIAIGTAAVIYYGARLVIDRVLTPGDLIVFLAYFKSALRPIRSMAKYSGRVAKAAASAERIVEVLDTTPLIRDQPGAEALPDAVESVRFENVTFGYDEGQVALDGLTLEARRGEVVVLSGPSGAGKSTVVNLLLRLYDPRAGAVTVNGRDAREYAVASLRRSIAVVPQENVLFAVSIRDNIAFGAPGAGEEQIIEAAMQAQAHEFIMAQPNGYDTVVGERGGTLSEGQRQRIAIARAAIRKAPILVLDEPTSNLDNENTRLVREALRVLSADRICFVIAHDLATVQEDNRVIYLEHGRLVEQGTHRDLVRREGRYAAMYALEHLRSGAPGPGQAIAVGG